MESFIGMGARTFTSLVEIVIAVGFFIAAYACFETSKEAARNTLNGPRWIIQLLVSRFTYGILLILGVFFGLEAILLLF